MSAPAAAPRADEMLRVTAILVWPGLRVWLRGGWCRVLDTETTDEDEVVLVVQRGRRRERSRAMAPGEILAAAG